MSSTAIKNKTKKQTHSKQSKIKVATNDDFNSDECSDTSLENNKSVEVKKKRTNKKVQIRQTWEKGSD